MNSSELIINIKLEVYCSLKFISSIICSSCVRVHTPCLHTSPHSNGKHRDKHLKRNAIINLLIDTWIKHAANEKEYQTVSNIYQGQIVSNMRMVMPHTTLHLKKKETPKKCAGLGLSEFESYNLTFRSLCPLGISCHSWFCFPLNFLYC